LKALIELHTYNALTKLNVLPEESHGNNNIEEGMGIGNEQADLIKSILGADEFQASSIMIPAKNLFSLNQDDVIDKNKIKIIIEKGYSRIPVYENKNKSSIIGKLIYINEKVF